MLGLTASCKLEKVNYNRLDYGGGNGGAVVDRTLINMSESRHATNFDIADIQEEFLIL